MEDLAHRIVELQSVIGFLAGMLGLTALAYALSPVGECDRCAHCRQERVKRGETSLKRYWGVMEDEPICPLHKIPRSACQTQHEDEPVDGV